MKRPLAVKLRRYEVVGGLIWLAVYLCLMGRLVQLFLELAGFSTDTVTLNQVYFVACFVVTVVLFHRLLADSLPTVARQPLRVLCGILLGYGIYAVCQGALSIVYSFAVPELQTPNDDTVWEIAGESFSTMAAGAILLAPVTEETLLRGMVFGTRREKNRVLAYVVTALVFAAMHVVHYLPEMDELTALLNLLLYVLPSVALCACYEYSGTVWGPIALHMLLNGLSMWAMAQSL